MATEFTFEVTAEERERFERDPYRWIVQKLREAEAHDQIVAESLYVGERQEWTREQWLTVVAYHALLSRERIFRRLLDKVNNEIPAAIILSGGFIRRQG